jgi:hypothetical protein
VTESGVPTLKFGKKPAKKTRARLAKFTFSTPATGARFECQLGKGKFKPCKSPYKHKVGPGKHLFSVRVISGAGLYGVFPLEYSWKVLK